MLNPCDPQGSKTAHCQQSPESLRTENPVPQALPEEQRRPASPRSSSSMPPVSPHWPVPRSRLAALLHSLALNTLRGKFLRCDKQGPISDSCSPLFIII